MAKESTKRNRPFRACLFLLETAFRLPYEFAVPDLLYEQEIEDYDGAALLTLGLHVEELDEHVVAAALEFRRAGHQSCLAARKDYVIGRVRSQPTRSSGSFPGIVGQVSNWIRPLVEVPKKHRHAVDLIVVLPIWKGRNFGFEGGQPGCLARQIDVTRLDLCGLVGNPGHLVVLWITVVDPVSSVSIQVLG
jgi:hypothetical protein